MSSIPLATPLSSSHAVTLRAGLANLTFALSVFCYLKILPLQAEIQPFAVLPAFALLALFPNPLNKIFLGYGATLLAALLTSLALAVLGNAYSAIESIQSFTAVLVPVVIFVAIYGNAQYLSPRVLIVIVVVWVVVGLSQAYLPALQAVLGLDSLLSVLISRYSPESLRDWGRGATLLAPEPSYSAHSVFLFLVATLYFWYRGLLSRIKILLMTAAVLFLAYLNQSATMAVILIAYLALLLSLRALLLTSLVGGIALTIVDLTDVRFFQVALLSYDLFANSEIDNLVEFTNVFGSMRTISVFVAYSSVLTGRILGGGFGSWTVDFLSEMERAGILVSDVKFFTEALGYIVEVKPYSHLAMLTFELGIIGFALDTVLVGVAVRTASAAAMHSVGGRRYVFATTVTALVFLALANPVSAPEFWVAMALALNLRLVHGRESLERKTQKQRRLEPAVDNVGENFR